MKKKIFKYFACMITVAILATTLLLSWVNYEMFKGRVMSDLEAYGRVFAVVLSGSGGERDALESLTREKIRVTLVRADGEVDYDNFADPQTMENHADRPEIRQALETGEGTDIRNSSTVDQSAFYYAVKLENGDVFYLHIYNKTLTYTVDQVKKVLPTDTSDLTIVDGGDYVTLVTCVPIAVNSHRLLVRGTRTE